MGKLYHRPEWKEFRKHIIEFDGGVCQICGKSEADGIILQVHHKVYHKGKLPWEYEPNECQTLCKLHHAEKHDKVRPTQGWDFLYDDDLGDLSGTCEACGTSLRYLFYIDHPRWESLGVGTNCCDRMTGTKTASEIKLKADRKERFLKSKNWKTTEDGVSIERMKMKFRILSDGKEFFIRFMGVDGNGRFRTIEEAKEGLFSLIDSGDARRFKNKLKRRPNQSEVSIPLRAPRYTT